MKQRILVIKEIFGERNELAFVLVEPYIRERLSEGSLVNVHETHHTVLRSLLEEEEIFQEDITQEEINLMFNINTYDKVIYVPQDAQKSTDILVYDPDMIDKNMIFYHIGNMNVVEAYDNIEIKGDHHTENPEHESDVLSELPVDEARFFWLMVSLIPWLIFLLMNLLGYGNVSALPLAIAIISLLLKKKAKKKKRYREFFSEYTNVGFFVLLLVLNYQNPSWLYNIAVIITIMGMLIMLLMSFIKDEE
ncbi:hypothetical protein [Proteocatella sphenisci]|uniref:hypothetical protein n=1 Tax=Proteocatella sphenisci TaxID=181070 RepID=UPI00048DAE7C|nr:hypothetical protein [Proteocatella sphenisci]